MNKKIATLGIVSAGIAALTAFIGAARKGKPSAGLSSDGARPTGTTPPDNGPTAHAQPAPTGSEGHAVPDLAAGADPGQRAPEAFRPDMDAP